VADITVEVTSPGSATTWGYDAYGNNAWNQITGVLSQTGDETSFTDVTVQLNSNLLNLTLSSPDVFIGVLIEPNSFLINSTVNSVFGGESIIVEVTTPGSPTTWGEYAWNQQAWGQILGTQSEIGDELAFIDVNVQLNTNLLTVTLNPNYEVLIGVLQEVTGVLITSNVNSVFAGELIITNVTGITINSTSGTLDISANANVTPNTNLLNIIIGDESITGDANVTLSTNLLNATVGNVDQIIDAFVDVTTPGSPSVWGEYTWGQQGWGRIVGLEVEQGGEEVVVPSVEVNVIGNQLNTTIGTYSITADANLNLSTNLLNISLGDEDATPNTQVTLSTNLITASVGIASGQALVDVSVTGVSITPSTGRLFVSGWAVINIGVTNTWTVVDIAA
jgi:hypothetical protein